MKSSILSLALRAGGAFAAYVGLPESGKHVAGGDELVVQLVGPVCWSFKHKL